MKYFTHIWALITGLLLAVFIHGCINQAPELEKVQYEQKAKR